MQNIFYVVFLSFSLFLTSSYLQAEFLYYATDVGTLETERSEARSLNQNGSVAGKYSDKGQFVDFLWTPENGLEVITTEADRASYPQLNNLDQVAGFTENKIKKWLMTYEQTTAYYYYPQQGISIPDWANPNAPRNYGYSVQSFNDRGNLIYVNDTELYKSDLSVGVYDDKAFRFAPAFEDDYKFLSSMNNKSQVLITYETPGLFGTQLFTNNLFYIYDHFEKETTMIAKGNPYYGVALNDNMQVIARNPKGTEGFFWSEETGLVNLDTFIPSAMNNDGVIVGKRYSSNKKDSPILLRETNGTFIEIEANTDFGSYPVEKITNAWGINDKRQIVVTAIIGGKTHALLLTPVTK